MEEKLTKTALVYPGAKSEIFNGDFLEKDHGTLESSCAVIKIEPHQDVRVWQKSIAERIGAWMRFFFFNTFF
ncbi:MAG: hypothetical protein PF638_06665 [Candidatus Delongbacteria bacterium]|jgi:hypothetical protein|nr:hypothetical protein [Candidatus Delongbacteria bacterium]